MSNLVFLSFTARNKNVPQYTWYDSSTWTPRPIPFTGTPGPCLEAAEIQSEDPVDFLGLYLTDDLLGMICHYTNRHAERSIPAREELPIHSRLRAWRPVEVPELKKYFGLLLFTGKFLSPVE